MEKPTPNVTEHAVTGRLFKPNKKLNKQINTHENSSKYAHTGTELPSSKTTATKTKKQKHVTIQCRKEENDLGRYCSQKVGEQTHLELISRKRLKSLLKITKTSTEELKL